MSNLINDTSSSHYRVQETTGAGIASQDYAHKVQNLIKVITELRALGAQADISLPRIAVIGNQSAGKSSLVEAIGHISVPRAAGTCTRCPMECRLTHAEEFRCQLSLRIEKDEYGNRVSEIKERKFGPPLFDKGELEVMIRRAQLAILNPSVPAERFIDLELDNLMPGDVPFGSGRQLQFSANVVCVDLCSPEVTDLSFIDLPGIISNVSAGEDPGNIQLVQNLVKETISDDNTLILLTITMRDDIQNQRAALLAREADPQGLRTIGVLTKPDTLQTGEHQSWFDVLSGRSNPLHHGYYITKQPAVKELEERLDHAEARRREKEFFARESPWNALDTSMRGRLGTASLTKELSKLLSQLIKQKLPNLRQEAKQRLNEVTTRLNMLPSPPTENPIAELLKLTNDFVNELERFIIGSHGYESLIQSCRPAYISFMNGIFSTRPNFCPEHQRGTFTDNGNEKEYSSDAGYVEDSAEPDSVKEPSEPGVSSRQAVKYLADVRNVIDKSLTRELPYNVPFSVKMQLIDECFEDWPEHSKACFEQVYAAFNKCLQKLVDRHFKQYSVGSLYDHVKSIVEAELECVTKATLKDMNRRLNLEKTPFTLNLHYFTSYRDKYLNAYKRRGQPLSPSSTLNNVLGGLQQLGFGGVKSESLYKLVEPPEHEEELIVMAEVSAYFRVAYKRIIDDIPRLIDHEFLRAMHESMKVALIRELGIGDEDAKLRASGYLSEEPQISARRAELNSTRARMEEVCGKLFKFTA